MSWVNYDGMAAWAKPNVGIFLLATSLLGDRYVAKFAAEAEYCEMGKAMHWRVLRKQCFLVRRLAFNHN